MKEKKEEKINPEEILAFLNPNSGQYQKVDTVGPIIFDEAANTLQFNVKKTSYKSDFLSILEQLETHPLANKSLRMQAAGIRPLINELIVDFRKDEKRGRSFHYFVVDPATTEIGTIFPIDKIITDEKRGLLEELKQSGGEEFRIEKINNRLAEIEQILANTAEEYKEKQPEIISSIVAQATGTRAFYITYWCVSRNAKLDTYFKKQKKPEQPEKPQVTESVGKFYRKAGHLEDQSLLYSQPEKKTTPLFDQLDPRLQKTISDSGVDKAEFNRVGLGIKLDPSEQKIVDCLCQMLHEKSQNQKPDKEDYYTGNEPAELIRYGGFDRDNKPQKAISPTISFTLYELTKLYRGGEISGGRDVKHVQDILISLAKKNYPIRYERQTILPNKNRRIDSIQTWQPLYELVELKQLTKTEKGQLVDEGQLRYGVKLNPIFRDQIDTKFVEYPADINRRTIEAYGSHNVSKCTYQLRNYLMRERSSKHFDPEIYLDKLYWQLCEKWMQEGRKGKVGEYTAKAIETMKHLGLLESHEVVAGKSGAQKVIFHLNKEWQ